MFKRIVIHLDGPICSCEVMNLAWCTGRESTLEGGKTVNGAYLQVMCETCGTRLHIPNEKFLAHIKLERPYPGKAPEQPKLKALDGGKVIQFESNQPQQKEE